MGCRVNNYLRIHRGFVLRANEHDGGWVLSVSLSRVYMSVGVAFIISVVTCVSSIRWK